MADNSVLLDKAKPQPTAIHTKLDGIAERISRANINFRAKYTATTEGKGTEIEVMRQLEPYPKYITNGERSSKFTIAENIQIKHSEDSVKVERPKALYLELDDSQNWILRNEQQDIIASKKGSEYNQKLEILPEQSAIIDTILKGKEVIDAGESFAVAKMPSTK